MADIVKHGTELSHSIDSDYICFALTTSTASTTSVRPWETALSSSTEHNGYGTCKLRPKGRGKGTGKAKRTAATTRTQTMNADTQTGSTHSGYGNDGFFTAWRRDREEEEARQNGGKTSTDDTPTGSSHSDAWQDDWWTTGIDNGGWQSGWEYWQHDNHQGKASIDNGGTTSASWLDNDTQQGRGSSSSQSSWEKKNWQHDNQGQASTDNGGTTRASWLDNFNMADYTKPSVWSLSGSWEKKNWQHDQGQAWTDNGGTTRDSWLDNKQGWGSSSSASSWQKRDWQHDNHGKSSTDHRWHEW